MKPNDENAKLPTGERPFRILIISGSNRRQYNCPGVDSKSRMLMMRMADRLPQHWEIDYEDLGNIYKRPQIQSCNACVSTSMALCVWPCNCYTNNSSAEPDLMWDLDLYSRLDMADAWAIIGPINWYGPTSNLKLMFDRLVCMNGGNPDEALINHKNPEMAMALEHTKEWETLSLNHLEGRSAGFFCYGDDGGDEFDGTGTPKLLKHKAYFDPDQEPFTNDRLAYQSLVWQCRYGGIEVPDQLWKYLLFGKNKKYSDTQAEHMYADQSSMASFDSWVNDFATFVATKGKVEPGKYRAFGSKPSNTIVEEAKLGWRHFMLMMNRPPDGSSPEKQQTLDIVKEPVTFFDKKSEGKRLREH